MSSAFILHVSWILPPIFQPEKHWRRTCVNSIPLCYQRRYKKCSWNKKARISV